MGVEVDHDALVWLGSLNQPLALLAGVVGLWVAGRGEVPGVYNFDGVAALICKGNKPIGFFQFPPPSSQFQPAAAKQPTAVGMLGVGGGRGRVEAFFKQTFAASLCL